MKSQPIGTLDMDAVESIKLSKLMDDLAIKSAISVGLTEEEAKELILGGTPNITPGLPGWNLIEGRIDSYVTPDPKVSEVIAALEAIRSDQIDPFVILQVPQTGEVFPGFCQAWAVEDGYVCEIRIYNGEEFRHMQPLSPDAEGRVGEDSESDGGYGDEPNLGQVFEIVTAFIANPNVFPAVQGLKWWDMTHHFVEEE